MTSNVYVASIEGRSGKSIAALGLMEMAARGLGRLGFFRPVIQDDKLSDRQPATTTSARSILV